jgi:hypothetical protein
MGVNRAGPMLTFYLYGRIIDIIHHCYRFHALLFPSRCAATHAGKQVSHQQERLSRLTAIHGETLLNRKLN